MSVSETVTMRENCVFRGNGERNKNEKSNSPHNFSEIKARWGIPVYAIGILVLSVCILYYLN